MRGDSTDTLITENSDMYTLQKKEMITPASTTRDFQLTFSVYL